MTATGTHIMIQAGTATAGDPTVRRAHNRLRITTTERRHVPKPSGKPDPTAHLSAADVDALGPELHALRQEVLGSRGAGDAAYIRKVINVQRKLELASRAGLLFSLFPPAWVLGP